MLWSDKNKQTHSDKLLRGEQHVLVVPRYVFLKLSCPKFLVSGAAKGAKPYVIMQKNIEMKHLLMTKKVLKKYIVEFNFSKKPF